MTIVAFFADLAAALLDATDLETPVKWNEPATAPQPLFGKMTGDLTRQS
jgi:hypothetical protein